MVSFTSQENLDMMVNLGADVSSAQATLQKFAKDFQSVSPQLRQALEIGLNEGLRKAERGVLDVGHAGEEQFGRKLPSAIGKASEGATARRHRTAAGPSVAKATARVTTEFLADPRHRRGTTHRGPLSETNRKTFALYELYRF